MDNLEKARSSYLFILQNPSYEAARAAVAQTQRLGLKCLGVFGTHAIEVSATAQEAGGLMRHGLFMMSTKGAISREHVKESRQPYTETLQTWNARFGSSYRKRKYESAKRLLGRKWDYDGNKAPAPFTPFEPTDIVRRVDEEAKRRKIDVTAKAKGEYKQTREPQAELKQARDFFKKHVSDETLLFEVGILYRRAKKSEKKKFLNLEWLKILLELLLHAAAGEEPACRKMHGGNSVGIVFVESSRSDGPKFSASKRAEIENEIRSGLAWLVREHPSNNLFWVFDVQRARIDVADDDNLDDSDTGYDGYWRIPAMAEIEFEGHTYTADDSSIDDYRDDMRAHHFTDNAIVIFVSAFGMSWHAYSSGRRFIALGEHGNDWGGWGLEELNLTTAHEMCHQFGAKDEYDKACDSCGGGFGCDNIPNGNCEECAIPTQSCVMVSHGNTLCGYTRGQIGWADIFVEIRTDDEWLSGTDDNVELDIGFRTFQLDTPDHDNFENNNREGYAIWAGGNLSRDEIKRILIRKSSDGVFGGWKLRRIRVFHDGEVICDESPHVWLEDRKRWFLAKVFDETLINVLKLRVKTADEWLAGTDDDVTLRLAGRSWDIDSDADDFERNGQRTYDLDPRTGIRVSDLTTITIEKSPDGAFGGWKLGGLRLTVNGSHIYEDNSINVWLEDNDRVFSDSI